LYKLSRVVAVRAEHIFDMSIAGLLPCLFRRQQDAAADRAFENAHYYFGLCAGHRVPPLLIALNGAPAG